MTSSVPVGEGASTVKVRFCPKEYWPSAWRTPALHQKMPASDESANVMAVSLTAVSASTGMNEESRASCIRYAAAPLPDACQTNLNGPGATIRPDEGYTVTGAGRGTMGGTPIDTKRLRFCPKDQVLSDCRTPALHQSVSALLASVRTTDVSLRVVSAIVELNEESCASCQR